MDKLLKKFIYLPKEKYNTQHIREMLSQYNIANILGKSQQSVSIVLRDMVREGILIIEYKECYFKKTEDGSVEQRHYYSPNDKKAKVYKLDDHILLATDKFTVIQPDREEIRRINKRTDALNEEFFRAFPVAKKLHRDAEELRKISRNKIDRIRKYIDRLDSSTGDGLRKMITSEMFIHKLDCRVKMKADSNGRVHNLFTTMPKGLRSVIFNGTGAVEYDFKNCALYILSCLITNYGKEGIIEIDNTTKEFINLCSTGTIYEYFVKRFKGVYTRDKVKTNIMLVMFTNDVFSGDNTVFRRAMKEDFPQVYRHIMFENVDEYGRWDKSSIKVGKENKILSKTMQKYESNLVFNHIINKIKRINTGCLFLTIHDSITIIPKNNNADIIRHSDMVDKTVNIMVNTGELVYGLGMSLNIHRYKNKD